MDAFFLKIYFQKTCLIIGETNNHLSVHCIISYNVNKWLYSKSDLNTWKKSGLKKLLIFWTDFWNWYYALKKEEIFWKKKKRDVYTSFSKSYKFILKFIFLHISSFLFFLNCWGITFFLYSCSKIKLYSAKSVRNFSKLSSVLIFYSSYK